jgi:TRAP-type C4-dicarboxylate transport system permease small subunit
MAEKSKRPLTDLSERVTLWLARAGSVGLALMMFLTLFDVIGRSFDHPITGTVEVTELIMGMMIYLGVGYATFMKSHIRVDIVIMNFSPRVQAWLDLFTGLVGLGITFLISWQLFNQAASKMTNGETTQIWELALWPYAYIMAAASILMVTSLILHIVVSARVALGIDSAEGYVSDTPVA